MDFKGTKGKWGVARSYYFEKLVSTDIYRICEVKCFENQIHGTLLEPSEEEAKANALLISNSLNLLNNAQMHIDALDLSQIEFYDKYGFNVSELIPRTRQLIKESTEI